jgi:hypothetical protein
MRPIYLEFRLILKISTNTTDQNILKTFKEIQYPMNQ